MTVSEMTVVALLLLSGVIAILLVSILRVLMHLRADLMQSRLSLERLILRITAELIRAIEQTDRPRSKD